MNARIITLITIIACLALFRIVPHPPNVAPVIAMALFAGTYFTDKRLAFIVPLLAMLLSDIFIGFHALMSFVYIGVVIAVLWGSVLRKKISAVNVLLITTINSVVFFLITNFGAWLVMPELYPRTISGLMTAYIAAIPFYQNSLLGDLLFASVLFGGFEFAKRQFSRLQEFDYH